MNRASLASKAYPFEFWCAYAANTLLMVATSSLFRYADFVTVLGGNEWHLGWVLGMGATGAVAVRIFQGVGMDRIGAGKIWLLSAAAVASSLLAHFWIQRIGPVMVFCRIVYAAGLSGCFGASITFVSLRAPAGRTAEMIGTLGSSGFVGMAIGPVIADYLLDVPHIERSHVQTMFLVAHGMVLASLASAACAVVRSPDQNLPKKKHPPFWKVIWKYNPGRILYIGFAMGLAFGIPFNFVRTFAASIGVDGIRVYFLVYAGTAFIIRIFSRKLPDRWGVRPTVLLGAACLATSILSFLFATDELSLLIPGFFGGVAHAFIFPAAVAGSSLAFPNRYRGLATTLMLMMFDLGTVVGQPTVSTIWLLATKAGWPAYPTVFVCISLILMAVAVAYHVENRLAKRVRAPRIDLAVGHDS